ncbi:flavin reductase [Burkholderia sp. SCN-KJ]|uniref:flavin reductase n=1 Tax=Burkholderia sp. SCN-KJ TaxID=2969248 RepID=UPI00214F9F3C|nr:flavin reductase [Burkholderia sp. SCN-KJ]MCR4466215.1 flavin reductase [Burkholderia sp. SCN-KJ]
MPVDRLAFREAMAHLGAAVNIITSDGVSGRAGMTASAVFSVTDEPPTVAVCINRSSRSEAVFRKNGVLCINTVSARQRDVAAVFAGATRCAPEERFGSGSWMTLATGAPVLQGAAAAFDGVVTSIVDKGTHAVFFVEVRAVAAQKEGGLVYFRRDFHPVGDGDRHDDTHEAVPKESAPLKTS